MNINIYLKSKSGYYSAEGIYSEGKVIVKKGSQIRFDFAEHIRGGKKAKTFRNDHSIVNEKGIVLKDCDFTSPSTAAQFITGRSTNGYEAWKVDDKTSLGKHIGREKSK